MGFVKELREAGVLWAAWRVVFCVVEGLDAGLKVFGIKEPGCFGEEGGKGVGILS